MTDYMIKILIVEDERIVAEDIESSLIARGYETTAIVSSGEAALKAVEAEKPDVILMDIVISGQWSGIETSAIIKKKYGIPVVFVTAYADESTLEKAKLTEPFGYLVKPFNEKDIKSAIELAIFRHSMEKKLRESEAWLGTTLRSLAEGVIATGNDGRVTFMNPAASDMIGIELDNAENVLLGKLFHVFTEDGLEVADPVLQVLESGEVVKGQSSHLLTAHSGKSLNIKYSAAPIKNPRNEVLGVVLVMSDVTRQRKAQDQLKAERDFNDTLLRITPAFFIAIDAVGKTIMMNETVCSLLGYQKEDVAGKDFIDTFIPDYQKAEMRTLISQMTDFTEVVTHENRLKAKDGKEVLVEWHGKPVHNNLNELDFYFIMGMDITSRRQTEEALIMSEERYRGLFETMEQGVVYYGIDGKIISCNPSAEKILGMSMYEMAGRSAIDACWDTINENGTSIGFKEHPVLKSLDQGTPVAKTVIGIISPEGKRCWLLLDATPVYHAHEVKPVSVFTTFSDITRRREIELKLERRNTQLNSINTIARSVGSTLDIHSIMDTALKEVLRLAGFPSGTFFLYKDKREEIDHDIKVNIKDPIPQLLNKTACLKKTNYRKLLSRGVVKVWQLDELIKQTDSFQENGLNSFEELQYVIAIPIREGDYIIGGVNLVGGASKLPDIAEMDFFISIGHHIGLAIKNGRLYNETNETLEKLKIAQDKLIESEKLIGLGALASNVVHEIGNPLAAISNSVQVLQGRVQLEGKMKELMDIIGWEADRLERSVNELREFSRPKKYNFVASDIREVVIKSIQILSQDLELVFGRKIYKNFSKQLPLIKIDSDAIEQVAINLLKNALQAVSEGGVVNLRLKVSGKSSAQMIVFDVKDDGPGIAKEEQKKIFEPYFTTKARGMGLGMHIVKENIKAHGGRLDIISEPGKGTIMRVQLPVEREQNG